MLSGGMHCSWEEPAHNGRDLMGRGSSWKDPSFLVKDLSQTDISFAIASLWRNLMNVRIHLPQHNIPQSVYKHGVLSLPRWWAVAKEDEKPKVKGLDSRRD